MLGFTAEEINTRVNWGSLIHPEDRDQIWADVQEAVKAKQPYRLTYRIRTRQGRIKWVWEQGRGVYGPDGELVALEGFITDVSPWKGVMAESQIPAKR
jgi:PAS domain S-box-containing protein